MASQSLSSAAAGPPYPPTTAGSGGSPTITLDVPITSVFLFLFAALAVVHMIILQINKKRSHKFLASVAIFGFCMARITACVMRLVWSSHADSIPIAIAANVFVNAGAIIIVVINIVFAQRILRASSPAIGWYKLTNYVFLAYYLTIFLLFAALITSLVQQLYTLNGNILHIDHKIQLVGSTYLAVAAFMPVILVSIGVVLPKLQHGSGARHVDKFGSGRFRTQVCILFLASTLTTLGAGFRAGTAYTPRPVQDPAWYHSKACFYAFNFTIDIIVLILYAAARVDHRFHVPDGASAPGHYSGDSRAAAEKRARVLTDDAIMRDEGEADDIGVDADDESWGKRAEVELKTGIHFPPVARAA